MDTTFQVGDQPEVMLQTKDSELLDAAEVGKLRPRWEGPFPVAVVARPKTYTLTLPAVNVDRLKPYFVRTGRPPSPQAGSVTDPGQVGEYVVQQLLDRKTVRCRTYLVRSPTSSPQATRPLPDADRGLRRRGRHAP